MHGAKKSKHRDAPFYKSHPWNCSPVACHASKQAIKYEPDVSIKKHKLFMPCPQKKGGKKRSWKVDSPAVRTLSAQLSSAQLEGNQTIWELSALTRAPTAHCDATPLSIARGEEWSWEGGREKVKYKAERKRGGKVDHERKSKQKYTPNFSGKWQLTLPSFGNVQN